MTRLGAGDVAAAVVLFAASVTSLHLLWPNLLVPLDEGVFLYEAKRVADGQVMYRDFFDLIGPLANYALALMYLLFGASMETARGSMAVVHALIVVLMYAIARRLGVRPLLAVVVCLTHLALFYPELSFASPHWYATALTLFVFLYVLRGPATRVRHAVALGVLTGLVGLTQQPKGAATAAAVGIVLIRDVWTGRQATPPVGAAIRQLCAYGVGLLATVVAGLSGFVAAAGFEPVYDALVRTPLGPYRQMPFHSGGRWLPLVIDPVLLQRMLFQLFPMLVISVMPCIMPLSAARLIAQAARGVPAQERRPLFVAVVFSTLSIVSVLYQPNAFHFAIVGPIWLSLYAESLERLVQRIEGRLRTRLVGPLAALAVLALLSLQFRRALTWEWAKAGAAGDTLFGRVHFPSDMQVDEIEAVRTVLQDAGAKRVFVYPYGAAVYLMTATSNPTRFQLLIPGYNTAEQFAEVQRTLDRERVPFVVRSLWLWGGPDGDPLLPYLREHYQAVLLPRKQLGFSNLAVWRRKADGVWRKGDDGSARNGSVSPPTSALTGLRARVCPFQPLLG